MSVFNKLTRVCFIILLVFFSKESFCQIRIGFLAGLTGDTSILSFHIYNTLKMEVEKVNQSGGINGKKIELVVFDDQSDPLITKKIVESEKVDNVHIIIGLPWSRNALMAIPVLQRKKIPTISIVATDDKVGKYGDYIFQICFNNSQQGKVLSKFAYSMSKNKKAVIFVNKQNSYSYNLADIIKDNFTKLGGRVVNIFNYIPSNEWDFHLKNISSIDKDVDVIFVPDDQVYIEPILKAFKISNFKNKNFYGTDGWNMGTSYLKRNELFSNFNFYVVSHWKEEANKPENIYFKRAFSLFAKQDAQDTSALTFDAFNIVMEALKSITILEKNKIKEALENVKHNGITGTIQMSSKYKNKSVIIYNIKNGVRTCVQE